MRSPKATAIPSTTLNLIRLLSVVGGVFSNFLTTILAGAGAIGALGAGVTSRTRGGGARIPCGDRMKNNHAAAIATKTRSPSRFIDWTILLQVVQERVVAG